MAAITHRDSERLLVKQFLRTLRIACQGNLRASTVEFNYESGKTDVLVLAADGELLAFEAKISNWRRALHQAWRNTSYVHRAYVVLPRSRATAALANRAEFEALGVGLCIVDEERVVPVLSSVLFEPVLPWLHEKARRELEQRAVRRSPNRNNSRRPGLRAEALSA